jgi:ribosomal protein S18 acetylase RimI-like enzyme
MSDVTLRRAERRDLPALGRLGAMLMRAHYAFDQRRFLAPGDDPEGGYAWFLGTQLDVDDAVIFVAERASAVVGYVYAGVEGKSWKELRDVAGFIHDVAVDAAARRGGVAARLVAEAAAWLRAHGMTRLMLWTAEHNPAAQALFAKLGFRRTMIEMTRDEVG